MAAWDISQAERLPLPGAVHAETADAPLPQGRPAPENPNLLRGVQSVEENYGRDLPPRLPRRDPIGGQGALLVGHLHPLEARDQGAHAPLED
ncbi:hypothetical protein ACFLQ0_02930 [Nitrospinota bacterium]